MTEKTTASSSFGHYRHLRSSDDASAWVKAIVAVEGEYDVLSHPDDLAAIVASFAECGVTITASQAQSVFYVYAEKDCAGWVGAPKDAVAGLDQVVDEIRGGNPHIPDVVAALKDWYP